MNQEISFGQIVRERRRALDLTQAELARRVGCATVTVRKIEYDALRPSQQIAELLAKALAIPLEERVAFVRLARTAAHTIPEPPPLPTPPPTPDEIGGEDLSGRAIRGYDLGERIGAGGFGAVYRGVQPLIEREVAIKIILPQYADHPEFIRRFEAEAQLVARLEHPHIVPLYDYWREPGVAYLVMRLLRGGSLYASVKDGPLALEVVATLLEQIGAALHAAHRAGVIHRDLKPANVLLDEDGNGYLADFGIAKNLNLEDQTQAGAILGSPAYLSPEQILSEPVKPQADIYCLGVLLYELLSGQKPFQGPTPIEYIQQHLNEPLPPLATLPALDAVIRRATAKDPMDRYPDVLSMLADFRQTVTSTSGAVAVSQIPYTAMPDKELENPYKGLRAFGEADADDFFGREMLVQALLGRMGESDDPSTGSGQGLARFLAVVGPSGSGKSSVVRAGLIPALRRGGLPGSENWFIVEMLPGTHPLEELEAALLRVAVNPPQSLLAQLREDERGLLRAVRRILPADEETELVLVIDQFEELFTLCSDEAIRVHLLDSLLIAVLDPRSRLRVIVTLRADFTDRPLQYVDFGELLRQRTEFVLPLSPDEMEEAIIKPAERVGLAVEPGLPETVISDLGDQPGTLPLLQYTLTVLFERRVGRALTLGAYQASGGVRGALASRADQLYAGLDEAGRQAARQLFLRLVTPGEISGEGLTAPDTRRRVLRAELTSLDGRPMTNTLAGTGDERPRSETKAPVDVHHSSFVIRHSSVMDTIIDTFGRHRLLTFDRDPATRGPTVEVAHEALIREWGQLKGWLEEDREFLLWGQRLRAALHQWEASEGDEGALLRGAPLAEAENWFNQRQADLSQAEGAFVQASLDLRERRAAEREAQRQRELEAAQKLAETEKQRAEEQTQAAGRLKRRARLLAGASVIAILLAVIAFVARQQAAAQRRVAVSRELAAAALSNLDIDPERSILLALEAVSATYAKDKTVTREAEEALHQVVPASRVQLNLSGHTGHVYAVLFSPDGMRLATAGADGSARIWDTSSGRELLTLAGHSDQVFGLAYSADGTHLVTASFDGTAKVWLLESSSAGGVTSGRELLTLTGHSAPLLEADFSPDGTKLATASYDGTARVWDAASGREILTLTGHAAVVNDVGFSPDEAHLATASHDGTVRVWDAVSGRELLTWAAHDGSEVWSVTFNPSGTRLATASQNGTARVWDISTMLNASISTELAASTTTGQELLTLPGHMPIPYVRFSPDGKRLATGRVDGTATVWDATTGQELLTLAGHTGIIIGVAFSPDGTRLATGSMDGTAKVWDLSPDRELLTLAAHTAENYDLAFSPDGTRLATASFDGTTKLWDAVSGQALLSLPELGQAAAVRAVAFGPKGKRVATGNADGTAAVWLLESSSDTDATNGQKILTLSGHAAPKSRVSYNGVTGVAFSPDGARLATASDDGTAKVWLLESGSAGDASTGRELLTLFAHPDESLGFTFDGVIRVVFSPDGKRLATAGADGTAKVWDAITGRELLTLSGHTGELTEITFSPDGTRLATSSVDSTVKLWNATTGQELLTLAGHTSPVFGVAFSPDGTCLATSSDSGVAKVWNAATGQVLLTLSNPIGLQRIAFSPDGKHLAIGGQDGNVRFYVLPIEELVALAQSRVTRSLTTEECQRFLHKDECPAGP